MLVQETRGRSRRREALRGAALGSGLTALLATGSAAAQWPSPGQPTGSPPPAPAAAPSEPGRTEAPAAGVDPYGRPVSAGGLDAPPPMSPTGPPPPNETDTDRRLDDAEKADSGRGLTWFWLEVEGGFQYVALETFTADEKTLTAGFESSAASGGWLGAGLGVQLFIVRIGPRFRVGFFPEWQMYSIDGEVGLRIPIGIVEPHVELAAGYAALGSLGGVLASAPESVRVDGFNLRAGGGIDFFPTPILSVGAMVGWEVLGLTRSATSATPDAEPSKAELLAAEGSGYGQALTLGARLGLNF